MQRISVRVSFGKDLNGLLSSVDDFVKENKPILPQRGGYLPIVAEVAFVSGSIILCVHRISIKSSKQYPA